MKVNLTGKQKQLLYFISDFYDKQGYSPTLDEIRSKLKISKESLQKDIKALIKKELLHQNSQGLETFTPISRKLGASSVVQRSLNIGIIGFGMVGKAIAYGFSTSNILIYDKYKDTDALEKVVKESEFIFICLPTPIKEDETGIDLTIFNETIRKVTKYTNGTDKIVVIKSTVVPGTTKNYIKKYPKTHFCFNPEFLTERSYLQDFVSTDRIVIGANDPLIMRRVTAIYQSIMPNTPIFETDPTSAEMVKYMSNCLLATKVSFANEMYEICQKLKIDYENVKKMVISDKRIGPTHLDITAFKGFGGKCFPKDLLALRGLVKKMKLDTTILDAVWEKNLKVRKVHDWEEIPFAVGNKVTGNKS